MGQSVATLLLLLLANLVTCVGSLPVEIRTETAMRDSTGAPIRSCFQPFIFRYPAQYPARIMCYYAYCFDVANDAATVWTSEDSLRSWQRRDGVFPYAGKGLGRIRWVLYNSKNQEYVGFSQNYTARFHVFTAPGPLGPFTFSHNMTTSYGTPADSLFYPDPNSGKAYLVYNDALGHSWNPSGHRRRTFVVELDSDFYQIRPSSSLGHTNVSMEGLWLATHGGAYHLPPIRLSS